MELVSRKYIAVVLASLIICLMACKPPIQVFESKTTVSDSTKITTEYLNRDTTIVVNADTSIVFHKVICDSNNVAQMPRKVVKGNTQAKIDVEIVDGELKAIALCNALELKVELQDKLIKELRQTLITKENTVPIITNQIPKIVLFLAWVGGICLFLLIIGFTLKFIK